METLRTHDDLDVAVYANGPEDAAVTVLLAHCWTSDAEDWRYQLRDLAQVLPGRVRTIAWDHRGHGASQAVPRRDCTVGNLARDMADIIDTFAPTGPLVLAGHSIGGMTIMALAEQRPDLFSERVQGVLLTSTSAGDMGSVDLGLPEIGDNVRNQIPRLLALRAKTLSKRVRRRTPIIERQIMSRLVFGQPQRVRDVALAVDGLVNSPGDSVAGFYEDIVLHHERTDALKHLSGIPTTVLVGAADRLTPVRMARHIVDHVDSASLYVAPDAGHMLPLERDAMVSDALLGLVRPLAG
ncbi:alpha/beta hydrolase [Marmoricola endophyticus]|uniref:Alpha/beta hydrolase n=1 Tax=Marmoricola endophyticus TaxID=2040280 RepID=A0A917F7X6_9ACTN|nr:alpha/beta hydrolase [Marmoricola endophyticus]GGF52065.1 alpha/beta hydrolase [Marmoricola endophyticus]